MGVDVGDCQGRLRRLEVRVVTRFVLRAPVPHADAPRGFVAEGSGATRSFRAASCLKISSLLQRCIWFT